MTEKATNRLDVLVKAIGFLSVVIGGGIGLFQYVDLRNREIDQFQDLKQRELAQFADLKEREFYSELWKERLRLYLETLDVAARISTAETLEESKRARIEFRTLFDGSMSVVQDPLVDKAIHEFAEKVDEVEAGRMDHQELGMHSYQLGRECYRSLENS